MNATSLSGRSTIYTILCDVLFQLLVLFLPLVLWVNHQWQSARLVASQVPDLENKVGGLQGQLEKGRLDLSKAHRRGAERQSIIDGQHRQIGDLHDTVGQLTVDNGILRSRIRSGDPVSVVVLIDVTASMAEPIDVLRSSMAALFEFMPNTSKDFRVGIVAFRRGVVETFPITSIVPVYDDEGMSQQSVLAFLASLQAERGFTDHEPVFREALDMLAKAHPKNDPDRKERLIFLGDMGPAELDKKPGYNAAEREMKNRILSDLQGWASQRDRAVEALYAESEWTRKDPGAAESREWFESIGNVSPKSAFYTDTNALLRAILHASLN